MYEFFNLFVDSMYLFRIFAFRQKDQVHVVWHEIFKVFETAFALVYTDHTLSSIKVN